MTDKIIHCKIQNIQSSRLVLYSSRTYKFIPCNLVLKLI